MVYLGGSVGWFVACALVLGLSLWFPWLAWPRCGKVYGCLSFAQVVGLFLFGWFVCWPVCGLVFNWLVVCWPVSGVWFLFVDPRPGVWALSFC